MSIDMLEKDEEMLWQSKAKLYFQTIAFLISLLVLVIGLLTNGFFNNLRYSEYNIFNGLIHIIGIAIIIFPLFGIISTIINWLTGKSLGSSISYFATNNRIIDKREKKEYSEYFTFDYSKIIKIEVHPSFFFEKRGVSIRIFPKFNPLSPYDWNFKIFKEQGLKLPQRLMESYHVLYNISDYKPLLKILEQNHVKIIYK